MGEIRVNVADAERAVSAQVPEHISDAVVAALAADPETISELDQALGRTMIRPEEGVILGWGPGPCDAPPDAGLMYVDLAARVIACQPEEYVPPHAGGIGWHDGTSLTGFRLNYHLDNDWLVLSGVDAFQAAAAERRRQRFKTPPLDTREVLYGRVPEFIVESLFRHRRELSDLDDDGRYQLIKQLHAEWLLTVRDDLRGRSPREVLLEKRKHIDADVFHQEGFWSRFRRPPPPIGRDWRAYRFGGFGTHEIVLYYELVRYLFQRCLERLSREGQVEVAGEIERLKMLSQEWLHGPQEDLDGRTAIQVIDWERMRLPMMADPAHAAVDPDCPLCQMIADESFGPSFWHLDGSNMDWDFAFSFCETREEWEEEERLHEEFDREWEERERAAKEREQRFIEGKVSAEEYLEDEATTWRSSWSNLEATDSMPAWQASRIILLGIGCHLGELCGALGDSEEDRQRAGRLRESFTELRRAVRENMDVMVASEAAGFCDELSALGACRGELEARCRDLARHVDRLVQRCHELARQFDRGESGDDDIPL